LARIICIDYGGKRCGLAVTDPLQIIATALTTVATKELYTYLAAYFAKEPVELILIGEPLNLDDTPTHATPLVKKAIIELGKKFPKKRYSSVFVQQQNYQFRARKLYNHTLRMRERRSALHTRGPLRLLFSSASLLVVSMIKCPYATECNPYHRNATEHTKIPASLGCFGENVSGASLGTYRST
jgi:putative Holliday junction resolvase